MKLYNLVCRDQRTNELEILGQLELWEQENSMNRSTYNHKVIKDLMKEKYPTYHCWEVDCGLYEFCEHKEGQASRYEKTVYKQEIIAKGQIWKLCMGGARFKIISDDDSQRWGPEDKLGWGIHGLEVPYGKNEEEVVIEDAMTTDEIIRGADKVEESRREK